MLPPASARNALLPTFSRSEVAEPLRTHTDPRAGVDALCPDMPTRELCEWGQVEMGNAGRKNEGCRSWQGPWRKNMEKAMEGSFRRR